MNSMLHFRNDNKFQIISLLSVTSAFQDRTTSLHSLLGTSALQNALVKLSYECLADIIVIGETDPSVLPTPPSITINSVDNISLTVIDNNKIIKLLVMTPLVGNYGIKYSPLDKKLALQSITEYHPFMTS